MIQCANLGDHIQDVWQSVRHLDLNIKRQGIDALEGDVLDAGNCHATSSTDVYLPGKWTCQTGNPEARRESAVNASKLAVEGRSEKDSIVLSANPYLWYRICVKN